MALVNKVYHDKPFCVASIRGEIKLTDKFHSLVTLVLAHLYKCITSFGNYKTRQWKIVSRLE